MTEVKKLPKVILQKSILFQGDCIEIMDKLIKEGVKVDAIITDPPYGISYQSSRKIDKTKRFPKILNDDKPYYDFISGASELLKDTSTLHIFTRWDVQQQFIDEMKKYGLKCKNVLIWDKVVHGMGDLKTAYGSRYESILFSSGKNFRFINKRPTDILRFQRCNPNTLKHPNEKPVSLLECIITDCVPEGGVVLDMFMGSGSTGVACQNLNRKFIGIEKEEKYFNIAVERLQKNLIDTNKVTT